MAGLKKILVFLAITSGLALVFVLSRQRDSEAASVKKPRLAVILIVDQMRPDYLERFKELYTGGLGRLLREGAVFNRAYHDFAFTETSPGHATLSTGVFPSRHGIVGNNWFDREDGRVVYSCDDFREKNLGGPEKPGRSPRRLMSATLGDWLVNTSPKSRVVTVALKDRSAILSAGLKSTASVFWFSENSGNFVTSTYYTSKLPDWVERFNAIRRPDSAFYSKKNWEKVLPADSNHFYLESAGPDSCSWEYAGPSDTFPHRLPTDRTRPDEKFYKEFMHIPFGDELVLRFAQGAVENYELGRDKPPDLLYLCLSSADLIGHRYGPHSQEIMDYYLRLDRYLAGFFEFLDEYVGHDDYLVALSSDHGVLPLPNHLPLAAPLNFRVNTNLARVEIFRKEQELKKELEIASELFVPYHELEQYRYGVNLNYMPAESAGLSREGLEKAAARKLRELPFVTDVYTAVEFAEKGTFGRPFLPPYRRNYYPARGPDLFFRLKKYGHFSKSVNGTSHGSPYAYDTQVPMIFFGPGIPPRIFTDSVRTVDFAPTVFELLGKKSPKNLDGVSLAPKISGRR